MSDNLDRPITQEQVDAALKHPLRRIWREYGFRIPNILNHGLLTSDTLVHAVTTYHTIDKKDLALFLDSNGMAQLLSNGDFANWLDPISRLETMKTGKIGTLLGVEIYSDTGLHPAFKFIDGIQLKARNKVFSKDDELA
jgi:hypothetical protein